MVINEGILRTEKEATTEDSAKNFYERYDRVRHYNSNIDLVFGGPNRFGNFF